MVVEMNDGVPYDLISTQWFAARKALPFRERAYVDRFLSLITGGNELLDLGCGGGLPIMRYLLDLQYRVTGLDVSPAMLQLARTHCPEAPLLLGDMTSVEVGGAYHGIIAWDSVFHIPRVRHAELFRSMYRWLAPGGPLLLSVGGSEGEFTAPMFGVEFFYSGHDPDLTRALLEQAGFEIHVLEIDDPSSRGHVVFICRKILGMDHPSVGHAGR